MANPGDIRAGGAFVEIGATLNSLDAGLKAASAKLGSWASGARESIEAVAQGLESLGTRMMAVGGAMLGPLALAAKSYADYGENVGKLASKTGMSEAMIAGLGYAAESSGIAVGAVSVAVKGMQRAIVDGSRDSQTALAALGTSSEALKGMSPDEQFSTLAEALSNVADPAERATLAQQVFGRSAQEILPILEEGAAGLARYKQEAQTLGLAPPTEAAKKLDDAFDRLHGSLKGLLLTIGEKLAPVLTPIVDRVVDIVIAFKDWISVNGDAVIEWAKLGAEIFLAGAAFLAIGATIAALMSPVVLITLLVAGIGMAVLAVLDVLGITQTGFGDFFNAIRIDGTGLGTWLGAFVVWLYKAWNEVTSNMSISWDTAATLIRAAWSYVIGAVSIGIGALIKGFGAVASVVDGVVNAIIITWNRVARIVKPEMVINWRMNVGGALGDAGNAVQNFGKGMIDQTNADVSGLPKRINDAIFERDKKNAAYEKEIQKLFQKDPQDNTTGVSVDLDKAKNAGKKILDGLWDKLGEGVSGALGGFNIPKHEWGTPAAKKNNPVAAAAEAASVPTAEFSVAGTFSGYAGSQMGASGIFQKQLQVQQQQLDSTRNIERNTRPGEGGGLV